MNLEEIRKRALSTSSIEEQKKFSLNVDMGVRRNLAMNPYIDSKIANKLLFDPVVNVAFQASKNRRTTIKRNFCDNSIKHPCVICHVTNYEECFKCKVEKFLENK